MKIVAGGDSMIWGSELADSRHCGPEGYSLNTYPALLAKDYGMAYQCVAYPGNANNAISRSIITHCENDIQPTMILVTWTFLQRVEFRFSYLKDHASMSDWYSINSWHCDDKFKFNSGLISQQQIREFAKTFFKFVGNNEYFEQYSCLKEILFLQLYLKSKNIPYLFTTTNNEFFNHANYQRHDTDLNLRSLYQQINWENWYFFPPGFGENQTETPRGFYQWAVENKYKVGLENHPLEDAHRDAAELIKEKFNELVKKSI